MSCSPQGSIHPLVQCIPSLMDADNESTMADGEISKFPVRTEKVGIIQRIRSSSNVLRIKNRSRKSSKVRSREYALSNPIPTHCQGNATGI